MQILECRSIKEKELIKLKQNIKTKLSLAVIQIGEFKENALYLKSKKKLALDLGVELIEIEYNKTNTKEEIINKIIELNLDENVIGIIIQKPILSNFDYQELVDYIDYRKDIDGVTKTNQERLVDGKSCLVPCTARAVLKVLEEYQISIKNRKIAIVGKSNLVGVPLYHILKDKNEVTLYDSKTNNLLEKLRQANIIITAIGKANFFDYSYFNEGQVIIDVGTNYKDGKLVGDVNINSIEKEVSITPVPGGVGQLTSIYLFWNLIEAKKIQVL